MGKLPHVGPETFGGRGFEAREVITLVPEFKKCPSPPTHSLSGLEMASGMIL